MTEETPLQLTSGIRHSKGRRKEKRGQWFAFNMCCWVLLLAYVWAGEVVFSLCWRERGNRCKCVVYVTHVVRREWENSSAHYSPLCKPCLWISFQLDGGLPGLHGHPGIRSVSAGVHRSWVCLELPVGRERQVCTAELIFLTWHWEMKGRGKEEINYVCFDVSHQRKLKLLFGNCCVQEEAWISPPFLVQMVEWWLDMFWIAKWLHWAMVYLTHTAFSALCQPKLLPFNISCRGALCWILYAVSTPENQ